MTGSRRGCMLLLAHRQNARHRMPPLGPPPQWLNAHQATAWRDLVAATPGDVLRAIDGLTLSALAVGLAMWREGYREPGCVLHLYRFMGHYFISMTDRRRLLFPDRPLRRAG